MSTKGQTINDRLNAAKYTLAGRFLPRCVCKATTEEMLRPKKKHLDYLKACTFESDISMQQLASQLIERTEHSNWVVVYKALITIHHLMSYGSERFTQYLASSNYTFQPSGFQTRGYSTSAFIRRYAAYINQKALSYRLLAVDLCRKQRTSEKILRSMPIDRLLETLPVVQRQLDTLLDFSCTVNDLGDGIIVACFTLLFQDAIRLFASYNDGIINLFDKYFDLNKKMCREAFEAYKKFLNCADRVADFLKVAEAINLDRGEIPDFKRAPSSLLEALEQHLISLESNKKRDRSVSIDTTSATLPSFSTNLEFEPSLSMVAKGLDMQSSISSSGTTPEKAMEAITLNDDKPQIENPIESDRVAPNKPINISAPTEFKDNFETSCNSNEIVISSNSIHTAINTGPPISKAIEDLKDTNIFGPDARNTESAKSVDLKPPGYSDGTLLTPECTMPARLDPSIDPQTQQQLINIQREQAALRQHPKGVSSNPLIHQDFGYTKSRAKAPKSKQESIFEDLEKTMRQSLMKVEKA